MVESKNCYKKLSQVRRMRNVKDVGIAILSKMVSTILTEREK